MQSIKIFLWVAANFTGKYPADISLGEVQCCADSWPWTEGGLGTSRSRPTPVQTDRLCSRCSPVHGHLWQKASRHDSGLFTLNKFLLSIPITVKPPCHVFGNLKGTQDCEWESLPSGLFSNQKVDVFSHSPPCFLHQCLWSGWPVAASTLAVLWVLFISQMAQYCSCSFAKLQHTFFCSSKAPETD